MINLKEEFEIEEISLYMACKIAEKIQKLTKSKNIIRIFTNEFDALRDLSRVALNAREIFDKWICMAAICNFTKLDYDIINNLIIEAEEDAKHAGYDIDDLRNSLKNHYDLNYKPEYITDKRPQF